MVFRLQRGVALAYPEWTDQSGTDRNQNFSPPRVINYPSIIWAVTALEFPILEDTVE
jgi:hypothetical protein